MVQPPHIASSTRTATNIMVITGLILVVSLVGNAILGISVQFPMLIPLWCVLVIGGSLYLLAYQEQVPDVSHVIQRATVIDRYTAGQAVLPNTLYAITDIITTDAPINDAPDHRGGNYVVIERIVEEFTRENDASNNHTHTVWKEIARTPLFADRVRIGAYTFTPTTELFSTMPYQDLAADPVLEERDATDVDKRYLYIKGPLIFRIGHFGTAPGDRRISYRAIPSDQRATLVGVPTGDTFAAFVSPTGLTLHQIFAGTLNDAVNTMRHEFVKARRQTRLVVTVAQLIAWCVLCSMIDIGTRLAWDENALYVNLAVGAIGAIASVIIVSVLYDPIKHT